MHRVAPRGSFGNNTRRFEKKGREVMHTHRRSLRLIGFVIGTTLALVPATASSAFAEATTTRRNEVNLRTVVPITNVCTGESIVFDVTYHFLERITTDAQGGVHYTLLIQGERVVGTSSTGVEYVGKNMYMENSYTTGGSGTDTFTFVRPLHLVSKGDGDNRLRNINAHVTRTPDGGISVDLYLDRPECQG